VPDGSLALRAGTAASTSSASQDGPAFRQLDRIAEALAGGLQQRVMRDLAAAASGVRNP
jgi:hypothetical protein